MGVLLILIGLFHAIFPQVAWQLELGWKMKEAEPSDHYLFYLRGLGVLLVIVGFFKLF